MQFGCMAAQETFLYALVFVVGLIIGRLTMALQYALMKDAARKKS